MKLGLGAVQFGLDYGVANRGGRPDRATVEQILRRATAAGLRVVDTAPAYGDSEALLGELACDATRFEIVTKTPARLRDAPPRTALASLQRSLMRLRRPRVHAWLVHDAHDLLDAEGPRVFAELVHARETGLAERIGVSVYDPLDGAELAERYDLDVVQLPISVVDQRALTSGALRRLAERGVEVHARSAFLQGMLLMAPDDAPDGISGAREAVAAMRERARELALSPLQLALGFASSLAEVEVVLCGVERAEQLDELVAASSTEVDARDVADLARDELALLEPSRWPSRPPSLR